MATARGALEFDHISKAYATQAAVDDLSLVVQHGELLTLLGPSGSGKTTTLMMAAGFIEPDAGRISLGGRDITHMAPQRRNIGVVFQSYALFPHRTVAENIAFPLRMRGLSRDEQQRRTREALDLVHLSGYQDRYPRQLSGGQQQRVAFARALVFNPPLLLMDEPLGALDRNLRKEMQFELRQMQERLELTIVYVTHDQEEALTLSDRIAVMRLGRIEHIADPETIYTRPASAFVAGFLGEMNLLPGILRGAPGTFCLQLESGARVPVAPEATALVGQRHILAVRPELVRVRPPDELDRSDLAGADVDMLAHVTGSIYLGDAWLYELTLDDGTTLRAKRPADSTRRRTQVGAPVRVGWPVSEALLLDG